MDYDLRLGYRLVDELTPCKGNARTHSDDQVTQIAASIRAFGWTNPILVEGESGVIAGHGRLLATKKLDMSEVPVIELTRMSEDDKRSYIIADNQLALNVGWDTETLAIELGYLADLSFDLSLTAIMDGPRPEAPADPDEVEERTKQTVSHAGDVWLLGLHRLVCGTGGEFIAVDRAIESWQACAGKTAKLEANGRSYANTKEDRGRRVASSTCSRRQDREIL
jgi:ParB-like chromosome segregation protein Spo0J